MDTKTKVILIVALILILGVGVGGLFAGISMGRDQAYAEKDAEFEGVLKQLAEDHEQVVVKKNEQVASLQEALSGKDAEIGVLADLVTKLKDRPAQVRYITRVETVLQPTTETVTVPVTQLPNEHLFALHLPDGQLVVARVGQKDTDGDGTNDTVDFTTYEQRFVLDAALGENSSAFLLRGSTSYDGTLHDIPVEVHTTRITPDPPKLLKVHLAMGVTLFGGAVATSNPRLGAGASLTLPWMHPRPDVDVLTPRITLGGAYDLSTHQGVFTFRGGADLVTYNLGKPGRFIQDLWLGVGPSYGTDNSWSVDLSLTTRL